MVTGNEHNFIIAFHSVCLTNGRAYNYTVTAVDSNESESLQTASVTATPVAGTAWE